MLYCAAMCCATVPSIASFVIAAMRATGATANAARRSSPSPAITTCTIRAKTYNRTDAMPRATRLLRPSSPRRSTRRTVRPRAATRAWLLRWRFLPLHCDPSASKVAAFPARFLATEPGVYMIISADRAVCRRARPINYGTSRLRFACACISSVALPCSKPLLCGDPRNPSRPASAKEPCKSNPFPLAKRTCAVCTITFSRAVALATHPA
jgi:hypothetical protein